MPAAALRRRALGVGLLAMLASSPGQTYMVSAFHGSWTADLGLSKTELGSWYGLGSVAASLCLVAVGRFSDRRGPRLALAAVALALGLGCCAVAGAVGGLSLTLGIFLIRLFGQGSMGLVSGHAMALAYEEGLGKAEGLRVAALSIAVGAAPALALALIEPLGWRLAFVTLGLLVVAVMLPASRLLPRPAESQPSSSPASSEPAPALVGATLAQALRSRAYLAIAAVIVLHASAVTAVHFHSQPLFAVLGVDGPTAAAQGMSIFASCMLVASLAGGWVVDRAPWGVPFATSSLLISGSMLLLDGRGGEPLALAGMGVLGAAQGFGGVAVTPSVARCFGRAHYGAIRGSLATAAVAGASAGPVLLGWAADHAGGFPTGLYVFAALGPLVALLNLTSLKALAPAASGS